jgi:hypothetical protein
MDPQPGALPHAASMLAFSGLESRRTACGRSQLGVLLFRRLEMLTRVLRPESPRWHKPRGSWRGMLRALRRGAQQEFKLGHDHNCRGR